MQTIDSLPNYHLLAPSQSKPYGSRSHQRRISLPVSPRGTPDDFHPFPSPSMSHHPSPSGPARSPTARQRSPHPPARLPPTSPSAHDPPVDPDDEQRPSGTAPELLWRQLDEFFFHEPMDRVEGAERDWVRGFGDGLLRVLGVRLRGRIALLRAERDARRRLALSAATGHPLRHAPAALRPIFSTPVANMAAFGANLDLTCVAGDVDSPAVTETDIDEPNAAPPGDLEGEEEDEIEPPASEVDVARRASKAERDIEIAAQVHEAAWLWIGAHLDHYSHIWRDESGEKDMGKLRLWRELVELRREMDRLDEEVLAMATRAGSIGG